MSIKKGGIMKQSVIKIIKSLTWQKLVVIATIVHFISPYFLGSCFDKEFLNNIDANKIRDNYTAFYNHEINEEYVYVSKSNYRDEEEHCKVEIYVYNENKFKQRLILRKSWYLKLPFSYNSVTEIKKNNMKIIVTEFTKKPRSKKAQAYLEEVLAQLES